MRECANLVSILVAASLLPLQSAEVCHANSWSLAEWFEGQSSASEQSPVSGEANPQEGMKVSSMMQLHTYRTEKVRTTDRDPNILNILNMTEAALPQKASDKSPDSGQTASNRPRDLLENQNEEEKRDILQKERSTATETVVPEEALEQRLREELEKQEKELSTATENVVPEDALEQRLREKESLRRRRVGIPQDEGRSGVPEEKGDILEKKRSTATENVVPEEALEQRLREELEKEESGIPEEGKEGATQQQQQQSSLSEDEHPKLPYITFPGDDKIRESTPSQDDRG